jgi:uncharacterized protein
MTTITVIKRKPGGAEIWRYDGDLQALLLNGIKILAQFNLRDREFMGIWLKKGDPFVEWYFTDRWYNVFAIYDRDDGALKGWYCNICKPLVWEDETLVSYEDLALDLWVTPDGRQHVLDEDEFAALDLDVETKAQALAALDELSQVFRLQGWEG